MLEELRGCDIVLDEVTFELHSLGEGEVYQGAKSGRSEVTGFELRTANSLSRLATCIAA